jgi:hypothetical protein
MLKTFAVIVFVVVVAVTVGPVLAKVLVMLTHGG